MICSETLILLLTINYTANNRMQDSQGEAEKPNSVRRIGSKDEHE